MAADPDAGMETCPSPEIGDSRKRPLDSDTENGTTKRSHFSSGKLYMLRFRCSFRFHIFFTCHGVSCPLFFVFKKKNNK